jgi:hypothetical protein
MMSVQGTFRLASAAVRDAAPSMVRAYGPYRQSSRRIDRS